MQILNKETQIPFLSWRLIGAILSVVLIASSISSLMARGLLLGLDFTGGTLVELQYQSSVDIGDVRQTLAEVGYGDSVVQYFGTARDVMVRVPLSGETQDAEFSTRLVEALRVPFSEVGLSSTGVTGKQQCSVEGSIAICEVQLQRVEFVGPQFGAELLDKGLSALMWALGGILIYVMFRFEWRFALASVIALIHDVLITLGFFSIFGVEFSLPVLAALLAVIGYSLNDTIVVFDRIRENFRTLMEASTEQVIERAINQTLPRTILTSVTTMLVLLSLYFYGGEVLAGFSLAMIVGVIIGTYSSVFIASPAVYSLGVSREDLLPPEKDDQTVEGELLP